MSRIGRQPVKLPDGVTVSLRASSVDVKGPRGSLSVPLPQGIAVEQKDGTLAVARASDERLARSLHGLTTRAHANAVTGV
jgi:large subunit ribosomal protein L6